MAGTRIASAIDLSLPIANQKAVSTTTALARPVVFTAGQLEDKDFAAKQLTAISSQIAQVTQAQRSHPEQAPITFKNVDCGTGGSKITLSHGFGVHADFIITKWKGVSTSATHSLICDEDDASDVQTNDNKLVLRSYIAGKANIRVFPGT